MPMLDVPPEINRALRFYYTCEATTVNREGQPVTWPTLAYLMKKAGRFY